MSHNNEDTTNVRVFIISSPLQYNHLKLESKESIQHLFIVFIDSYLCCCYQTSSRALSAVYRYTFSLYMFHMHHLETSSSVSVPRMQFYTERMSMKPLHITL